MKYLDFTKGYVNMRNWQPKITQKDIDKDKDRIMAKLLKKGSFTK